MQRQVDPDYQRKIDSWNQSHPGPADIAVAWNPKAIKIVVKAGLFGPVYDYEGRWQVFAIPVNDSPHPKARNELTKTLMKPFPDDSGRVGILLFTWCKRGETGSDIGEKELDDSLFATLAWADSFADRQHYEHTIEATEQKKEMAEKQATRDIAYAGKEYWWNLPNVTVSMNPQTRAGAGWRDAKYRRV